MHQKKECFILQGVTSQNAVIWFTPRQEYSTTHITVNSLLNFTEPKGVSRQIRLHTFATGPCPQFHESSSHSLKLLT